MRKLFLSLVFVGNLIEVFSVDNLRLPDIRSLGMGGNVVTQSVLFNPSLVVFEQDKSIHLEYFNRYLLKETGTMSASFHCPNPFLSAGVEISVFGYDKYRETMFRLIGGKQLGERWTLGVGVHYRFLQAELLDENKGRVATDIGLTFSPIDKLLIGLLIVNFPSVNVGNKEIDKEKFRDSFLQIGFQWEVINSLLIAGSLETNSTNTLEGNLGVEYMAFDSFWVRAGLQTTPLLPSLGIGYKLSAFRFDTVLLYHPMLGMSTGLGLSYSF